MKNTWRKYGEMKVRRRQQLDDDLVVGLHGPARPGPGRARELPARALINTLKKSETRGLPV